ncbi:MAG: DUF4350 domain-containing protein [Xenococcaceae cyanobacterium MO_207.B15]|nr:DUF4350 domain-containing protein [Xenococcaceae cyanobacterium MO_207.B15]
MNINRKKWWILGIILVAVTIFLTLLAAPNSNKLLAGSTFGKNPNGYGAWYQYMIDQGAAIERWQKPFSALETNKNNISYLKILPPQTSKFYSLSLGELDWVKQGNTIVILGIDAAPTVAPFTTTQSYKDLQIKIATTRRKESQINSILQDEHGSIVWQTKMDKGKVIYAVTPYIAANAYQQYPDNYQFLAELVSQNDLILVDEYLHGYKDREVITQERKGTLLDYFTKTVWMPIAIQVIIITVIAIASKLPRFGKPTLIRKTQIDNSQAYIQALAAVLEKAQCSDFVVKIITKDEKLKLQQSLGLGKGNIPNDILLNTWQQTTGKDSKQLQKLLQVSETQPNLNYSELIKWLKQWQHYHSH